MDIFKLLVLGLVFLATLLLVLALQALFQRLAEARVAEAKLAASGEAASGIFRIVSQERLQQLRISFAVLGAGILAGLALLSGLAALFALAPLAIGAALGYMAPLWYYSYKFKERNAKVQDKILDLVLGMTGGLRAGVAIPQALETVSRDLGGPLQEEISIALKEYRAGVELSASLERMMLRVPSDDMRLLTTSIRLSLQTGGSLADVLASLADTVRKRKEFQGKLQTMTAQGRFEALAMASAPLVAFGILYFIQPDLMMPLVTTPLGWLALGVMLVLETIGFFVLNAIVTIEV